MNSKRILAFLAAQITWSILVLFFIMSLLSGCSITTKIFFGGKKNTPKCYAGEYSNIIPRQPIKITNRTSSGIQVDASQTKQVIDLVKLDKSIKEIEECVTQVFNDELKKMPTAEDMFYWGCVSLNIPKSINRDCLVIKILDPFKVSEDGRWKLLDALAPPELCVAKGLTPDKKNPCRWRSVVQDDNVVITSDQTYLWDVIRVYTQCNNIWGSPLAKCGVIGL